MTLDCPTPTRRIRFRPYELDDVAAVEETFADPVARQFYPTMGRADECLGWIQWNLDNYAEHGFGLWAIERIADGAFLGDCGVTLQPVEGRRLHEVGYHLVARHRGRGYAVEAATACVEFALTELAAPLVCSIVDPANATSRSVASKVHTARRTFVDHRGHEMCLYWTPSPGFDGAGPDGVAKGWSRDR